MSASPLGAADASAGARETPAERRAARLPPVTLVRDGSPVLRAREADTFLSRLCGLLVLPRLDGDDALVIRPCASVHTFGMRYAIDVVFLDEIGTVLKVGTLAPRRALGCRGARAVVELAAGTAQRLALVPGQCLDACDGGRP